MGRTVLLLGSIVAAMLLATGVTLVAPMQPAQATFPGENGRIAYQSADHNDQEIYTILPGGGSPIQLTDDAMSDVSPSLSPDGQTIAYMHYEDGDTAEIYTIPTYGGSPTQVTDGNTRDTISNPSFSPDGQTIAYQDSDGEDIEIYTIPSSGGSPTQVTDNAMSDVDPSFSPDGQTIAYACVDGRDWEICTIPSDGGAPTQLTDNTTYEDSPSFSPDGQTIAYTSTADGDYEIYTIPTYGGSPTQVTDNTMNDYSPAFSPDGQAIAYVNVIAYCCDDSKDSEIYTIPSDGGSPTQVTDNTVSDGSPDWGVHSVDPRPPPYDFIGFFSPVDNMPTVNKTKAGQTIPVKFSLNGDQGLDIFAEGYPKAQQVDCDTSATTDTIEETVSSGSTGLSYDPTTDQYTYAWKTDKKWANTCRQLVIKLDDVREHKATFKFTK